MVRAEAPAGLRLLTHPLTWVDVFTSTPLEGNALAVVHDADVLDAATMLAFARETRLSETTFVQADPSGDATYVNRIWTMGGELDFAGHPSLGTAVAVAHRRGDQEVRYVQRTRSGLQPVDVLLHGDATAYASMLQNPAVFGAEPAAEAIAALVGLPPEALRPDLPPRVVSTGQPNLMVCLRDRAALDAAAPSYAALAPALQALGALVLYLAVLGDGPADVEARGFFCDPGVLAEDPATGSAAGALLAYAHERTGRTALSIAQGVAMGRPSLLECELEGDRVRVGGACVVVATGTVRLR